MIPERIITAWAAQAPWPTVEQTEQDLVLSRLIVDIANDPVLGDELVFRGGTCLHKIVLPEPLRYSEDLDYVRTTHSPIGPILDAVRSIGRRLGMDTSTDVRSYPKVRLRAPFESGQGAMRIKIEINTYETLPSRPLHTRRFSVDSTWWSGSADVLTFQPEELVATKLRALFQRRKGRDLFDLWLALTQLGLDPEVIIACFDPYRPEGYSGARASQVLDGHRHDAVFRRDLDALMSEPPGAYELDAAAQLVADTLLARL